MPAEKEDSKESHGSIDIFLGDFSTIFFISLRLFFLTWIRRHVNPLGNRELVLHAFQLSMSAGFFSYFYLGDAYWPGVPGYYGLLVIARD